MKILVGALLAVLIALGFAGWRLQAAWDDLAVARTKTEALQVELKRQTEAGERLDSRLVTLDLSLSRLHELTQRHTQQLGKTLAGIDRIEKSETDTHETIQCLDLPVPVELDGWLQ